MNEVFSYFTIRLMLQNRSKIYVVERHDMVYNNYNCSFIKDYDLSLCPLFIAFSLLFPDTSTSDSHFIGTPLPGLSVFVITGDMNLEGDGLGDHARHSAHFALSM